MILKLKMKTSEVVNFFFHVLFANIKKSDLHRGLFMVLFEVHDLKNS